MIGGENNLKKGHIVKLTPAKVLKEKLKKYDRKLPINVRYAILKMQKIGQKFMICFCPMK
jgi:hypothetical protein